MNLGRRFVVGSLQLGSGQLLTNFANLGMQIAIARLIGPAEFGLYAICFAAAEFINMIGSFSFGTALVQAPEAERPHFDTAFVLLFGLGVAGIAIATGVGPWLAGWSSPGAASMLVALACAQLLRFLWQVPEAKLARELHFGSITLIAGTAGILPNVLAVFLAWIGFGAWSLALRDLVMTSLLLGGGLWASGYRFGGRVERGAYETLMRFARPMFVSRSIEIVLERLDTLAAGIFFGERAAGLYHQSRFLADAGAIATRPVENITVNLYARVQDDPARLERAWHLVNTVLLRVMLTGAAALLLTPGEVVRLLLGEQWRGVVPILQWLALYAALLPLFQIAKSLCYGLGEVRRVVRVRIAQSLAFAATIGGALMVGRLEGLAVALLAVTGGGLLLLWRETRTLVEPLPVTRVLLPFVSLALTAGLFAGARAFDLFGWLAWPALPLVPPLLFLAILLVIERGLLVREARSLIAQIR